MLPRKLEVRWEPFQPSSSSSYEISLSDVETLEKLIVVDLERWKSTG
jgi:hypothetical protein